MKYDSSYELLGVSKVSSHKEVKRAYLDLVKSELAKNEPDEELLEKYHTAYESLFALYIKKKYLYRKKNTFQIIQFALTIVIIILIFLIVHQLNEYTSLY